MLEIRALLATLAVPPGASLSLRLDPASDTGASNSDGVTRDDDGPLYPAPFFDVSSVDAGSTVDLFRAPVVGGVAGPPVLVNAVVSGSTPGAVVIPDTDAGNGTIPDGAYRYSSEQVDADGVASAPSNTVNVVIDAAPPAPITPPAPVLDPSSVTGPGGNPGITRDNGGANPYPVFDVGTAASPVAPGASVLLFRAPALDGAAGTPVLVNTLAETAGGVVAITDANAGGGPIVNGGYSYTDQIVSLAGVPGGVSPASEITIDAATLPAPTSLSLDPASDTGVSDTDGITRITLTQAPVFDVGGVGQGATVNLFRGGVLVASLATVSGGAVTLSDPTRPPDGLDVYTADQVDAAGNVSPLSAAAQVVYDTTPPPTPPAPVLDPGSDTGARGDDFTSDTSPYLDVNVSLSGPEVNSSMSLLRDGRVVNRTPYNVGPGPMTIQDPGPASYGAHTYQVVMTDKAGNVGGTSPPVTITFGLDASGTLTLDPSSDSGVRGDDVTNVTSPAFDVTGLPADETIKLLRNGTVVASQPTNGGGSTVIGDPGPLGNGQYTYVVQMFSLGGSLTGVGPPLTITIDTTPPAAPTDLTLDPASDSGSPGGDVTDVTDPTVDVSSVAPGATVRLFRDGAAVAGLTSPAGGTVRLTDPGPLGDGTYTYTASQVDVAGNVGPTSAPLRVTVDTATPPPPSLALDPLAHTGSLVADVTTDASPALDASGVVAGGAVTLYRDGVAVGTVNSAAGGLATVTDPGPLAPGQYTYTASQTSPAGIPSAAGAPLTLTILAASAVPSTPSLALAASADTGIIGDGVTSARLLTFTGTADPGVTVVLDDSSGTPQGSAAADGSGRYAIALRSALADGVYHYHAHAVNSAGVASANVATLAVTVVTTDGDYTGTGASSPAVFRRQAADLGVWFVKGDPALQDFDLGAGALDVPVAADFNGDGRVDPALYRPSTGQWFAALSPANTGRLIATFGGPNDVPVPADYTGTGAAVESVFRPSTGQWFFYGGGPGRNTVDPVVFPAGSAAAPGDYDGVGMTEAAVYVPGDSQWLVAAPGATAAHVVATFGGPTDVPVPGEYDNIALAAAGRPEATEAAVWRPSTGQFFIHGPSGNRPIQFAVGDIPAPGDYDGVGETEPAVYRPSTSQWLVEGPGDTSPRVFAFFGGPADIPVLSPYPYRALPAAQPPARGGGGDSSDAMIAPGVGASASSASSPPPASSPSAATAPAAISARPTAAAAVAARPNQGPAVEAPGNRGRLFDLALESLAGPGRPRGTRAGG